MPFALKWLARFGALVSLVAVLGLLGYRYAYEDWPWNQPAKIAVCGGVGSPGTELEFAL